MTAPEPAPRARRAAQEALERIDQGGAYANLVLDGILDRHMGGSSQADQRDRRFATELTYGTVRMLRACDFLVDRFITRELEPHVRAALRIGAYQLRYMGVPDYAAVHSTVALVGGPPRKLVNAVLRRVADAPVNWPNDATRLSYPDWIVDLLDRDLGVERSRAALEQMNEAPQVTTRDDGYVQDLGSQWVAQLVDAQPLHRVADLCAAPGGKVTALAATAGFAVGADIRPSRARVVAENAQRLGGHVGVVVADGTAPPIRPGSLDRVLVDAPCSGLGTLRRRPDARWRVEADAVPRLAQLQCRLAVAAAEAVGPGGVLVYSVCTLSEAETVGVDRHLEQALSGWEALPAPEEPWEPHGRGAILLPQAAGTDGMFVLRLRRPPA